MGEYSDEYTYQQRLRNVNNYYNNYQDNGKRY